MLRENIDSFLKTCLKKEAFTMLNKTKLQDAVDHFMKDLPTYLKNLLINANFLVSEVDDGQDLFLAFYSNVLLSMIESFVELDHIENNSYAPKELNEKSQEHVAVHPLSPYASIGTNHPIHSSGNESKYNTDQVMDLNFIEKEVQRPNASLQLVENTKMHNIYIIPTHNKSFVLKVLNEENVSSKRLADELNVSQNVQHPAMRRVFDQTLYQNKSALVLEWFDGHPIADSYNTETFTTKDFLSISREIMSCMLAIHSKNMAHLNLTSDHILFNPETKTVKIIGYGSSTECASNRRFISNQELIDMDLRCISPEQTCRLDRSIDFRSDFYSLGVIFYRLLTGVYPFESNNAYQLLHMHILDKEQSVRERNPNIPAAISNMVMMLMRKDAEQRYQSSKGIVHDLDLMLSEYETDNTLSTITLKQHNVPEKFLISQQLYGRHAAKQSMITSFEKLATSSIEVAFVQGQSGTGK